MKFKPDVLATVMGALYDIVRDPRVPIEQVVLPEGILGAMFLLPAFAEFATRLHEYGRGRNEQHFTSWLDYFCGSLARFSRAHQDRQDHYAGVPVDECVDRITAVHGMEHQIHCLELATGSFLSAQDREQPVLKQMRNHCCAIGTYLNEIISVEKEVVRERADNLVPLLMARKGFTLRQSVQWVAARAQEHANEFEHLSIQALAEFAGHDDGEHALGHYVQGLRQMTAACWYWQLEGTTRYRSPTSPFAELLS